MTNPQTLSAHDLMKRKEFLSRLHELEKEFGLVLNIDPYDGPEIVESESTKWGVDQIGRVTWGDE